MTTLSVLCKEITKSIPVNPKLENTLIKAKYKTKDGVRSVFEIWNYNIKLFLYNSNIDRYNALKEFDFCKKDENIKMTVKNLDTQKNAL